MADDLIKRLKYAADIASLKHPTWTALMTEAADAIEELVGFVQEAERDRDENRERLDKANDVIEELVRKEKFHTFLWNTIQPNEMEAYLSMYNAGNEKGES